MATPAIINWRPVLAKAVAMAAVSVSCGCTVVTPISQFDPGIADLCREGMQLYRHGDRERHFSVVMLKDADQISMQCGPTAAACTDGFTIWVPDDASCPDHMAHELNHVFGMHFVDAGTGSMTGKISLYAHDYNR